MSYYGTRYGKNAEELFDMIRKYDDGEKSAVRVMNALCRHDIFSIDQLVAADENEIAKFRNIGLKSMKIIGNVRRDAGASSIFADMSLGMYIGHNRIPEYRVAKIPVDIWEKLGDHGDPNEILVHLAESYLIAYQPYKPKNEVTA